MDPSNTIIRIISDNKETVHIFDETNIINIRQHSEYLNEVFCQAEASFHPQEIILVEKDAILSGQFLFILGNLSQTQALPNLSYNLAFAELATKWLVASFIAFFKNYFKSFLVEICEKRPVNVQASSRMFPAVTGMTNETKLTPLGINSNGDIVYHAINCSLQIRREQWEFTVSHQGTFFYDSAIDPLHKYIFNCSGIWRRTNGEAQFQFTIEPLKDDEEDKFIAIARILRSNDEYFQATILSTNSLAKLIYKCPQLKTIKILDALMTHQDWIEYAML